MSTKPRSHRLVPLRDLADRHLGRQIEVRGLTGVLVGLVPCGDRVQLDLRVGGARVLTAALPGDDGCEVWKVGAR
jgi:hypothetical protein